MNAHDAAPRTTAQLLDELDDLLERVRHIHEELRRRFGHDPATQSPKDFSADEGGNDG